MDTKHSSFFKKLTNANFRGLSRSRGRRGHFGDLTKRNAGATHLAEAKIKMAEVGMKPLPSGYEYEFISTVLEDHHCLICHLPLREPVQTRCGHRFCKKCLDEAIRRYEKGRDARILSRPKPPFPSSSNALCNFNWVTRYPDLKILGPWKRVSPLRFQENCRIVYPTAESDPTVSLLELCLQNKTTKVQLWSVFEVAHDCRILRAHSLGNLVLCAHLLL